MKHKETLPEQVRAFLQEQQMVQAGDTICCALSGGADSVCLLRCLLELAEPLHLTITAVHVNHQLRGAESERDRKSTRLNSSHTTVARMPSSA